MTRIGELDRQITIQKRTTVDDSFGDPVETWSTVAVVWAHKREISGREIFEGGTQAIADTVFTIWHRADVTREMRIDYKGQLYDILSTKELGRGEKLEITSDSQVS